MSIKYKFLRSIIVCATAFSLAITLSAPVRAADKSDVTLGIFGGLLIATAIHKSQNRQINRNIQSQHNHRYNNQYSRHKHKKKRSLNRHGGRFQHNHGAYNWHYHQQH